MCQILPSKYWRVNISCLKSESCLNKNKKPYCLAANEADYLKLIEEFKQKASSFKDDITSLDTYNGYLLTLISPVQKKAR